MSETRKPANKDAGLIKILSKLNSLVADCFQIINDVQLRTTWNLETELVHIIELIYYIY